METEIKTFVYRDSDRKSEAVEPAEAKGRKKKKFIIAAVCFAVITMLVFGGFTAFGGFLPEEISEDAAQPAQAAGGTETVETEAADNAAVNEAAVQPAGVIAAAEESCVKEDMIPAQNPEVTQIIEKDESIFVELLSENSSDAELMEYIPALAGAEQNAYVPAEAEETAEETSDSLNAAAAEDGNGYGSKLEEALETIDALTPPEDLPSSLVYTYNSKMCLDLDSEQIECLERIVQAEAGDQDIYGRMLVANVVINRVNTGWAKTVKGVVFQRINGYPQFEPTADYGNYYKVKVSDKTREAVRRVLAGEDYSQGAVYFFQRSLVTEDKSAWFDNSLKRLFKYGCHEFYKEKSR